MTVPPPGVRSSSAPVRSWPPRSPTGPGASPPRVALVPTMGALHDGHASLFDHARKAVGPDHRVVTSIFVNPLQFGAGEDLDRYPRTLERDLERCAEHGVDVVVRPDGRGGLPRRRAGGDRRARARARCCSRAPRAPATSAAC